MSIPGFLIGDVVYESAPRIIYGAVREDSDEQVILKTLVSAYPSRRDVAEIKREYRIARGLQAVDGVIRVDELVSYGTGNLAIVMEPFGISLADFMAERRHVGMPLVGFFPLAIRIAKILGRLHEHDIVHKDIVPRNILVEDGEVRIIDFGISSELSTERQDLTISRRLEGSLPYISPEQTGRMNRALDFRSDYYSLGITYFELLTGRLPFTATNVLEWVHQHISRLPPPPVALRKSLPQSVSDLILKLISKNAEDRYQSTFGLISDLERCRAEFASSGRVAPFELGLVDLSRKFQIPQKLYGREEELSRLRKTYDEAAAGGTELCLVSGYSGVGKSALVNELSKSIVRDRGYLIQGKFDQFQQRSAYSAIAQAFQSLLRQILAESPAQLAGWREAFLGAIGSNGQVLIDLVPQLELVVGEQPPVPELPPTEAQNRFQIVFLNFVKVFADRQHPLVIFVDDLQWSDVPTLALIQRLVTAREMSHLLVIGAYRSNEVDAGHPLKLALSEIHKARDLVEVDLLPLDLGAVDQLTADTLHCTRERAQVLSEVVHEKSRGNPFFISELLKTLHEEGAIAFSVDDGEWTCRRASSSSPRHTRSRSSSGTARTTAWPILPHSPSAWSIGSR